MENILLNRPGLVLVPLEPFDHGSGGNDGGHHYNFSSSNDGNSSGGGHHGNSGGGRNADILLLALNDVKEKTKLVTDRCLSFALMDAEVLFTEHYETMRINWGQVANATPDPHALVPAAGSMDLDILLTLTEQFSLVAVVYLAVLEETIERNRRDRQEGFGKPRLTQRQLSFIIRTQLPEDVEGGNPPKA